MTGNGKDIDGDGFIQIIFKNSLSWDSNVHPDYLIPTGGRISDLSAVKLEHASTGGGFEGQAILGSLYYTNTNTNTDANTPSNWNIH